MIEVLSVRGITPVIAIILLLLMAVAAAGGFYFVYQGFTESGEESGSTQIEQLGEQSLAAIQIESAAGGRIYVKNVGASDVDLSKVSVYVENQPVSVNRSSDTLAERSRAVLKFTQPPSCEGDCEVRISGAASTSRTLDSSKLSCSSDSDCYSSESCTDGVCIEGEDALCGDDVCSEGEHGYDCWEDCHLDSFLLPVKASAGGGLLSQFDWNGTTYDFVENVTESDSLSVSSYFSPILLSNGNHVFSGHYNNLEQNHYSYWYSKYDGSSWSYPYNLSQEYETAFEEFPHFQSSDVDSAGNVMFTWMHDENVPYPNEKLQFSLLVNGVPTAPDNATGWLGATNPSFAFAPDDSGLLLYSNYTNVGSNYYKILYRTWDGSSFSSPSLIYNHQEGADLEAGSYPFFSFEENGDAMAVWAAWNSTNHVSQKYATYDGSSWTYQGNFEETTPINETFDVPARVEQDHLGNFVATAGFLSEAGLSPCYFVYDNGAWSSRKSLPQPTNKIFPHLFKMPDNTLVEVDMDYDALMSGDRAIWRWAVWDGDSWSDHTYVGPWQVA